MVVWYQTMPTEEKRPRSRSRTAKILGLVGAGLSLLVWLISGGRVPFAPWGGGPPPPEPTNTAPVQLEK